jgi:hypothetical protein
VLPGSDECDAQRATAGHVREDGKTLLKRDIRNPKTRNPNRNTLRNQTSVMTGESRVMSRRILKTYGSLGKWGRELREDGGKKAYELRLPIFSYIAYVDAEGKISVYWILTELPFASTRPRQVTASPTGEPFQTLSMMAD